MKTLQMSIVVFVLAVLPVGASEVVSSADVAGNTATLVWALGVQPDAAMEMPVTEVEKAADWLHAWPLLGPRVTRKGDTAAYVAGLEQSRQLLHVLHKRQPDNPAWMWKIARNDYDKGELLPEEAKDERRALYEEMVALTEQCVEADESQALCWHYLGTGIGRLATSKGVMSSLFKADNVEDAWQTAYELNTDFVALNGDPMINATRYGLGVFYRMVPDSWIVKLLAGTRGDIEKSIDYFRQASEMQPNRLELRKELAVALLCFADREDSDAALAEGTALLQQIVDGAFDASDIRATDPIDKRHAADLIQDPEKACGYSRDGYQDVSKEALEKAEKENKDK